MDVTPEVSFRCTSGDGDIQRHERISRVLKRFDYSWRSKRGVVLAYATPGTNFSRKTSLDAGLRNMAEPLTY